MIKSNNILLLYKKYHKTFFFYKKKKYISCNYKIILNKKVFISYKNKIYFK
ncbi:hypothetical protein [Candidatus Carsonella ruddii]|uniref:Uncharacterized protein n=1 Tax=Candidatus Carsonella ruddii (Diaphorina cf. continua) TaxID=2661587 RepID=A0A7R7ABG3_CARRU|nr:hypothetical protein [Candidatus Carsonella ruddii (Diaphorina cf. continua)]BCG49233.1 hypothetical protein CRDco_0155 [Candidatus Carsonella ruddii (Diaphorina cf. continua)]